MFYDFAITVPANTLESAPVVEELKLSAGVIHRVEVEFRFGPSHMVYVQIFQGGHQVWPTNPESAFRTDGRTISFDENQPIDEAANILTVKAFSRHHVHA